MHSDTHAINVRQDEKVDLQRRFYSPCPGHWTKRQRKCRNGATSSKLQLPKKSEWFLGGTSNIPTICNAGVHHQVTSAHVPSECHQDDRTLFSMYPSHWMCGVVYQFHFRSCPLWSSWLWCTRILVYPGEMPWSSHHLDVSLLSTLKQLHHPGLATGCWGWPMLRTEIQVLLLAPLKSCPKIQDNLY